MCECFSAVNLRMVGVCSVWSIALFLPMAGVGDTIVAFWDFGPDSAGYTEQVTVHHTDGNPVLSGMSSGTGYDADGQGGVSFTDVEGIDHASGQALAWGSGVNDSDQEWILSLDLTGFHDIVIRWDYRSTGTGPDGALLDYKTGSNDWNLIDNVIFSNDSTYHEYSKDLSSITELNNQADVQLRLSAFSGGSGGGTYRLDNLQLTAIPEPAALGFITLAGIIVLILRRFHR